MAMANLTTKYNATQPSSAAREEFIAVLDYLFNCAYDENHLSRNKDIIDFANKKYGIEFRKERVCGILIHLEQLFQKYPDLFPFELKIRRYKNSSKYYVSNVNFSDLEILDIIAALRNDSSKSQGRIRKLEDKVLSRVGGKEKQAELVGKLGKTRFKGKHISHENDIVLGKLKIASQTNAVVSFKVKLWYEFEISNNWQEIFQMVVANEEFNGYVHSIQYIQNEPWVVFYLTSKKAAIVVPSASIELVTNPIKSSKKPTFLLNDKKYKHVDNWIVDLYKGKISRQNHFLLAVTASETEKIKQSFENYFGEQFEIISPENKKIIFDGKQIEFKSDFSYIQLTCNLTTLNNWILSEKNNLFNITVIEPRLPGLGLDETLIRNILSRRWRLGLSNKTIVDEMKKWGTK